MPTIFDEIRKRRAGNPPVEPEEKPLPYEPSALRQAVSRDVSLSQIQQSETQSWLEDPHVLRELRSGALGAALGVIITRFLKMTPKNQLLLSIAGFGIGKIIYDYKNDPKNFSSWNKPLRMYEIN